MGAAESVARRWWIAHSQRSGRARNAVGEQEREGQAVVEAGEPGADEPHVVVERQPAHADVGRAAPRGPRAIARMLASRLAWVRSTPLGWPVLPEVYWMKAGSRAVALGPGDRRARGRELVGGHDVGERRARAGFRRLATGRARGIVTRSAHAGVREDGGLAGGVLLEPVEADGRVDRHRDGARERGCRGTSAGSRARWAA